MERGCSLLCWRGPRSWLREVCNLLTLMGQQAQTWEGTQSHRDSEAWQRQGRFRPPKEDLQQRGPPGDKKPAMGAWEALKTRRRRPGSPDHSKKWVAV